MHNNLGEPIPTIPVTLVKDRYKKIILLSGDKKERLFLTKIFEQDKNDLDTLQFAFFLKNYASQLMNMDIVDIPDPELNDLYTFNSAGILHRINDCINDTAIRLDQKGFEYNKMGLLAILNHILGTGYRLEHEIPEQLHMSIKQLTRQIGEIWKLVFTKEVWTQLVITAVNRSTKKLILVNDFRFPEEYSGLVDESIHSVYCVKILNSAINKEKEDGYHISEFALEYFGFDYLINTTIPYTEDKHEYITCQVDAVIESVKKSKDVE
jgi:hypothetical protein